MNENKTNINWYPGHMAKTRRELKEKISLIDVVYEVIDARMPKSSRIIDIDSITKNKKRIMVVTKYDLCDKKETDKILASYKDKYDIVKCNLLNNEGIKELINCTLKYSKDLNEERRKKGLKNRPIRVLTVGVPNVGKSTLINALVKKKAAKTGDKPGVTTSISWIRINSDIELLDSPGILWPGSIDNETIGTLASLSSVKEEIVDKEYLATFIIKKLNELYKDKLKERYNLEEINLDLVFEMLAKNKNIYTKGKEIDFEKVYTKIINDFKNGYFGRVTLDR